MNEAQWAQEARTVTWDQAEARYRDGRWSQAAWEAFAHAWRTSSFRYSSVGVGYEVLDDPEAIRLAAILKNLARAS